MAPVIGTVALVHRANGFQAFDYLVQRTVEDPNTSPPPDSVWGTAIDSATAAESEAVGETACTYSRWGDAASAFTRARESRIPEIAASAGYNLGFAMGKLGRVQEALGVYEQVVTCYATDPTVRGQVTSSTLLGLSLVWPLEFRRVSRDHVRCGYR